MQTLSSRPSAIKTTHEEILYYKNTTRIYCGNYLVLLIINRLVLFLIAPPILSDKHIPCYFQSLCPFVWKHPAHTSLPSADQRDQEVFEPQTDRLTLLLQWQLFFEAYRNLFL